MTLATHVSNHDRVWCSGVMTSAAFFDLDRTLLPKASGAIFGKYLEAEGLTTGTHVPGASLAMSFYELFGETRLNMTLTSQFVKTANGWPVAKVERAATLAAQDLADAVLGHAKVVMDKHRAEGTKLVLATTTPTVFVQPFADRIGFDAVLATEWSHDGKAFDGTTVGPFVWGPKKRDAIVDWAKANKVSLKDSYGYSDSYFDAPMLDAVGHAVAVNPDARLTAIAALQGWEIRSFDAPKGVMKVLGREIQQWLEPFRKIEPIAFASFEFNGLENIPSEGGAILAFNHRSYFDAFAMNLLLAKVGRPCRFLGKKEMFDTPLVGPLLQSMGGILVDRGTGSNTPLLRAEEALRAGELVAIAPQGTIPRGLDFFDPVLKGRPGAAQLAIDSKAPVIPIGLWGTEKVWPRSSSRPKADLLHRPTISMTAGPAVELKRRSANADTKRIMTALTELLPPEAQKKHKPTEAELARTYPKGKGPND